MISRKHLVNSVATEASEERVRAERDAQAQRERADRLEEAELERALRQLLRRRPVRVRVIHRGGAR